MRGIAQVVFLTWTVKQHKPQMLPAANFKYYVNCYPTQFSYKQFQYLPEKLRGRKELTWLA